MRVAQIAPLYESVPPKLYGGTERIVSYLSDELVRQGHDVTLFASGDSKTFATLAPFGETALRLDPTAPDALPAHIAMLKEVIKRADDFDVLHFHTDLLHFPMIRAFSDKTVTTLHGRLDQSDVKTLYGAFPEIPLGGVDK